VPFFILWRIVTAQLVQAARDALRLFQDQQPIPENDHTRARVLRALESLNPGAGEGSVAERRRRQHRILVDCDVRRLPHAQVAAALGLSRRQFYRDRRDALIAFAEALQTPEYAPALMQVDVKDVHLLYIQTLRERGQYDSVWRESVRALAHMNGHPREVEVWALASEAARYFGNARYAREAIDQMRRATTRSAFHDLRRASQLRIAISEIALDVMLGDLSAAKLRFEETAAACGDERTMYGRDVTLFAILLSHATALSMERGEWHLAEQYLHRSAMIDERSEVCYAISSRRRLRGRLAFRRDGDIGRAVVELSDALSIAESDRALRPAALATVELGIALTHRGDAAGAEYLDHGLRIAREVCGHDDFAVLFSSAVPALLQRGAPLTSMQAIEELRMRSPLFGLAERYVRLAEVELQLHGGDYRTAIASSTELADECFRALMLPLAAHAQVLSAEAYAHSGRVMQAKKSLISAEALITEFGEHRTRLRAEALGTRLALPPAVTETPQRRIKLP